MVKSGCAGPAGRAGPGHARVLAPDRLSTEILPDHAVADPRVGRRSAAGHPRPPNPRWRRASGSRRWSKSSSAPGFPRSSSSRPPRGRWLAGRSTRAAPCRSPHRVALADRHGAARRACVSSSCGRAANARRCVFLGHGPARGEMLLGLALLPAAFLLVAAAALVIEWLAPGPARPGRQPAGGAAPQPRRHRRVRAGRRARRRAPRGDPARIRAAPLRAAPRRRHAGPGAVQHGVRPRPRAAGLGRRDPHRPARRVLGRRLPVAAQRRRACRLPRRVQPGRGRLPRVPAA